MKRIALESTVRGRLIVGLLLIFVAALLAAPSAQGQTTGTERARLTWDTEADLDLHVWDEAGNHASYIDPEGIPDATLSLDDTSGYGPEFIVDSDATGRTFTFGVCYYNGTESTNAELTVTDPNGAQRTLNASLSTPGDGKVMAVSPSNSTAYNPPDDDCTYAPLREDTADPVVKFAPLVYLHPDEYSWPMSASKFIKKSRLMWAHGAGCSNYTSASTGKVRQVSLGFFGDLYSHRAIKNARCKKHEGVRYYAEDFTRPRDDDPDRPSALGKNEGFYLDLKNAFHYGTAPDGGSPDVYDRAPTYYEVNCADGQDVPLDECPSHKVITYWFSYGYSTPLERDVGAHEGDWEHINVHLSEDGERATQVDYFAHHDPANPVSYGDVEKAGTHPVVYSAKASHASYPDAGDQCSPTELGDCGIDETGEGRQWRTWESVEPVEDQPWYGFGGAWGRIGAGAGPYNLDTTGPLGPSPYKDPFGHG